MICKQCKQVFKGRSDAQYCSAKCRVNANRNSKKGKCNSFIDLPLDVQNDIDRVSQNPTVGMTIAEEKAKRTAAAIKYHNEHPGNQHKGIDPDMVVNLPDDYKPAAELKQSEFNQVTKPGDKDYRDSGILEKCRLCGEALPPLEHPRRYQGMCLACVSGGVKV